MNDKESIERHEERLRLAMLASNTSELDALLSDKLIFTDQSGKVLDKQTDLETHRSGALKLTKLQASEQELRLFGDTAIVSVLMRIQGSFSGQDFSIKNRYTRVWLKRNEAWLVVAAHSVLAGD
jgi:ketosteroid isomerase-like protein